MSEFSSNSKKLRLKILAPTLSDVPSARRLSLRPGYVTEDRAAISGGYFVEYFVSFGEIARETFATWREMRFFARSLPDGRVLAYGAGSGSGAGVHGRTPSLEEKDFHEKGKFPNAGRVSL